MGKKLVFQDKGEEVKGKHLSKPRRVWGCVSMAPFAPASVFQENQTQGSLRKGSGLGMIKEICRGSQIQLARIWDSMG
jgi:hypothetical protein